MNIWETLIIAAASVKVAADMGANPEQYNQVTIDQIRDIAAYCQFFHIETTEQLGIQLRKAEECTQ